jgi:hypothetical protein
MLSSNYLQNPKLYEGHQPNEPILLYEGAAEIVQESNVIEGEATVKFAWFPAPHTKFEFIYANQTDLESGQVTLNLTEMGVITEPYPLKITSNGNRSRIEIAGFFNEPVIIGTKVKIKSLLFHLTNIPFFTAHACSQREDDPGWDWDLDTWFGQFVYKTDRWRIVLVTMNNAPETKELLQEQGGYAFTHVCKLERTDESLYSLDEAREVLEAFSEYLSFARGIRVAPIFLTGYDEAGKQVWEEWPTLVEADPWQNGCIWFDIDSTEVVDIFPGFMRRWENDNWRGLVQESIHWYLESNKKAGGINGSIVLEQTALEKLAWVFLVEEKRSISAHGFEKIPAADQIRLLLSQLGIDSSIHHRWTDLVQQSKEYNWVDGPQAITELRNAIVHPKTKERKKASRISDSTKYQAWQLGLNYLEQVLLKLFDYPWQLDWDDSE